jgi:soluble lytic murein transglycosylase-like protein
MTVVIAAAFLFVQTSAAKLWEPAGLRSALIERPTAELDHRFDGVHEGLQSIEADASPAMRALQTSGLLQPAMVRYRVVTPTEQALARLTARRRSIAQRAIPYIDKFGETFGVYSMLKAAGVQEPRLFILSLIEAESNFNPEAKSPAGARGLMQVMPSTAEDLKLHGPITSFHDNIRAGMKYLARALRVLGRPDYALAAYSAGISRVKSSLKRRGRPPLIEETFHYVQKILSTYADWVGTAALAFVRPLLVQSWNSIQ